MENHSQNEMMDHKCGGNRGGGGYCKFIAPIQLVIAKMFVWLIIVFVVVVVTHWPRPVLGGLIEQRAPQHSR